MPIPQKPAQQARLSAKALVYKTLREWIVDGTLKPGEKIFDREIAGYFSVSRTPVREAMQLLSDQHLIDVIPGKESKVAQINIDDIKKSYIILAELHVLALRFAWNNLTAGDITDMESRNEDLKQYAAAGRLKQVLEMDKAFHDIIVLKCENDYIKNFTDILLSQVQRVEYRYFTDKNDYDSSVNNHDLIIQAIRNNDRKSACEALRQNWLRTMDTIETVLP